MAAIFVQEWRIFYRQNFCPVIVTAEILNDSSLLLSYTYVHYTILCTLYLCRLSNSTTTFYLVVTLCSMNRVHCPLSPASKLCQMLLAADTAAPLYTKMFIFVQLWAYLVIICSYSSRIISTTDVYSTHICHNIR